jgi:NADH oxidase (H2O-forming)
MLGTIEIKPGLFWIGAEDPELRTFDDLFPTEHGTTYNSFLIKGTDKVAIIDTVKHTYEEEYLTKIKGLVDPASIDYIVINHTEPDHSGSLAFLLEICPNATVVSTQAAKTFLSNLIHKPFNSHVVKDGEVIDLGGKSLRFVLAPFLHWPDTMFTKLEPDNFFFTCDAFGAHYCGGSLFNDQLPDYTADMQFYFDCIMRPFKDKALATIEKIRHEVIDGICPSHGPVLRSEPWKYIQRYEEWCKPVEGARKVSIFFLSPHGNTEKMALAVAKGAASVQGVEVESHHINHLSADELRDKMEQTDALIFGIPTINRDIPPPFWTVLAAMTGLKLRTNIGAVFGSYGWSGEAGKMGEERLKSLNFRLPVPAIRAPFNPRPEILTQCEEMGRIIAEEVLKKA